MGFVNKDRAMWLWILISFVAGMAIGGYVPIIPVLISNTVLHCQGVQ